MAKKFKNGLVLGKFMPPHYGHFYLIDVAASQCETLYVMVCSDESQPIEGEFRFKWVRDYYQKTDGIKVIWCKDKNPQYPSECESVDVFYKKYWVPSVYNHIKELDVVFTSEAYGDEFAEYLGIKHVCVDQARKYVPISGTEIRNNPIDNWKYIPKLVRPYFTKRVVLMGPESVGKSTLVKRLAMHYDVEYTEEYGRLHSLLKGDKPWTTYDFDVIAIQHLMYVEDGCLAGRKVHFVDTEAITTKVFGEMFLGNEFDSTVCDDIIKHQKYDLYLLLDVDVPWINDGTRTFSEGRREHFERLKEELTKKGVNFVVISGTYEERFQKAVEEVDKLGYLY